MKKQQMINILLLIGQLLLAASLLGMHYKKFSDGVYGLLIGLSIGIMILSLVLKKRNRA